MKSRRRICVALGASLALGLTGVAFGATVTPPAGTPDLAAMVLQSGDLAAGAVAGQQGYVKPPTGFTAEYVDSFTTAATPDGVSYYLLTDGLAIAPTPAAASTFFSSEHGFYNSKRGRKVVVREIIASAGKKGHLTAHDIKFASDGSIGVGTASFLETIAVKTRNAAVHEDLVLLEDGSVYTQLVLTGEPREAIPNADAVSLATAIDSHVDSVLAAGGATGASGASGASGTA